MGISERGKGMLFLGVANRVVRRQLAWDLEGVTNVLVMPFFPNQLAGVHAIFAASRDFCAAGESKRLDFVLRRSGRTLSTFTIGAAENPNISTESQLQAEMARGFASAPRSSGFYKDGGGIIFPSATSFVIVPLRFENTNVLEPDVIDVFISDELESTNIGTFQIVFARPSPISAEERSELRSRPLAYNAVQIQLKCDKCNSAQLFHAVLFREDIPREVMVDSIDLAEAPEDWQCDCGFTKIPLQYAKLGIHDLFRNRPTEYSDQHMICRFTPMYQRSMVDALLNEYMKLLDSDPKEEDVQQFLTSHHELWAFLAPVKIIPKPRLLTKAVADFAILTTNKSLVLIELEKPQTRLTKSDGGLHSELQKGIDQLRSWRGAFTRDFRTLIDQLGFKAEDVHRVDYIILAGMAARTKPDHLLGLRQNSDNSYQLLTFDELADKLNALVGKIAGL